MMAVRTLGCIFVGRWAEREISGAVLRRKQT
jgi:hypothetical protein